MTTTVEFIKSTGVITPLAETFDRFWIAMDISFKTKQIEIAYQKRDDTYNRDKVSFGVIYKNGNKCYGQDNNTFTYMTLVSNFDEGKMLQWNDIFNCPKCSSNWAYLTRTRTTCNFLRILK